jgi:pimeloyl-ACP methyl ester carboxylesterase
MMARILGEAGIPALLVDNRGAGKTEVSAPFTITDFCEDIVAIWDHHNISRSALLGISMGGFISQGIAIHHPSRVRELILVSSAPEERFINPTGGGWISEGQHLETKMRTYFAPGFVDRNPVLFQTMVAQIRQAIDTGTFTGRSEAQRQALKGAGWTSRLGEIQTRTLVVHGDQDMVIDVGAAHLLHKEIKGSKLHIIPGAGHLLLAEAPKELYRIVTEFLR